MISFESTQGHGIAFERTISLWIRIKKKLKKFLITADKVLVSSDEHINKQPKSNLSSGREGMNVCSFEES